MVGTQSNSDCVQSVIQNNEYDNEILEFKKNSKRKVLILIIYILNVYLHGEDVTLVVDHDDKVETLEDKNSGEYLNMKMKQFQTTVSTFLIIVIVSVEMTLIGILILSMLLLSFFVEINLLSNIAII